MVGTHGRTKIGGIKIGRIKIGGIKMLGTLGHWVAGGTPSASAKRSVEQKCGIKIGGTKNWRNKNWWGLKWRNKSLVGDPWLLGGGDP